MRGLFSTLPIALLAALSTRGVPQAPPITRSAGVAYISSQRISAESVDGKAGLMRLQAMQQERTGELRAAQQALEVTRARLSSADAAERPQLQQRETQQRADLEGATQRAQADLQSLQRQIVAEMQAKIKVALDDLLKDKETVMVLNAETAIVWAAPGLDLTSAVVERLNAKSLAAAPAK